MASFRRLSAATLGLLSVLAIGTACGGGDDDAPTSINDPAGLSSELGSISQSFGSAQFQSFSAASGSFGLGGITATPAMAKARALLIASLPILPKGNKTDAQLQRARYEALKSLRGQAGTVLTANRAPIIDPVYLGVSFEYNETNDQYEQTSRSGAPSGGVRFYLYAVDPLTGNIVEPVNEIGWVDIVDLGTASTTGVQIIIENSTTTYADYSVTGTVGATNVTAQTSGFASDGTHQVTFAANAAADDDSFEYHITQFDINTPDIGFTLDYVITFDDAAQTAVFDINFAVEHDGSTVAVDGTWNLSSSLITIDMNVLVDGHVVARIDATIDNVGSTFTYEDGEGNPLTGEQLQAVQDLFDAPDNVLNLIDEITAPAFEILGVSIGAAF